MKTKKTLLPISLAFMMCLTGWSIQPVYAAENADFQSLTELKNEDFSDMTEKGFQPLYDLYHMYGTNSENYSVYWKHNDGSEFEIVKKTYNGSGINLTLADGADRKKIVEAIEKYIDTKNVTINTSDKKTLSVNVEQNAPRDGSLNLNCIVKIVKELNDAGLISDAEFITSRFSVQTGTARCDKYSAENKTAIDECIKDSLDGYLKIEETSEYGDKFIKVTSKDITYDYNYKVYGKVYKKTGASHEIVWNDDRSEITEKTDMDTLLYLSMMPEYKADTEEDLNLLKKLLSAYPDFSDGGKIYVNPEYKVDFVKNDSDYVLIIHGLNENNTPKERSDVFTTSLNVPVFSLWDKVSRPVYSGEAGGGNIEDAYCSIVLCVENELPVKDVLVNNDKYEEIFMTEEETPEYMLKYIYPDKNISVLNGGMPRDMTLGLGDLNGDSTIDLTDLSILSLKLLGEAELAENQSESADVDEDEKITLADLAKIKRFITKGVINL